MIKKYSYYILSSFIFWISVFPIYLYAQLDFSKESVKARLSNDMLVLTSDSLQGRQAGTMYEIKARNFIAERFSEIGLKPIVGDTSYEQKFSKGGKKGVFYNVCGFLDNKAKKTVVIGAHYDHLGMGNFGSRYGSNHLHKGADDNASGTVSVFEMARFLKAQSNLKYNYLFIAFTAEELGLYGSDFFVNSSIAKKFELAYMINFDMVGRYNYDNKKRLIIYGTGSSPEWKKILKTNRSKEFRRKKIKYGPPFSDHTAFYNKGIPVLYFTTGLPEEYHTPFDTYQTINFDGMVNILEYTEKLTREIEKTENITFKKCSGFQIFKAYLYSVTMML